MILQFTIYNNSYVTTKEVRIYTEMHRGFFLRFFSVSFFLLIPKKGGKALLHYKGLQMYNYTVRSMWSLLGYIIDTDSTSKNRKTTKFYIYIYIYMQRSTPSIHVIFIQARPENESPMLNDLSAG